MFPLTRPMRQTVATIALVGLTVVPTGVVATIAWRINRPGHVRDVEIELGRQLGLQVTLEGVRYPKPGEVVYQGITLRQEEPRRKGLIEIGRADQARLQRADRDLIVNLENPRLSADSPKLALGQLAAVLQRSGQIPFERVHVTAGSCQLDLGHESLRVSVRDVAGELVVDPLAPSLKLTYRFSGEGAGTRCELAGTRDRRTEQIETSVALTTVEGPPLPARVLNVFFDAADWLGSSAKFEGTLHLHQAGSRDWEADYRGELHDVDLAKLVGRRFPRHRLNGRARVAIKEAKWGQRPTQGWGWLEAKGELAAGQGSIGIDLIDALAREMKFRRSPRLVNLDARKTDVDFRALGLSFAIESGGEIQIGGALGAEFSPDAVIAGATTSLLSAPEGTASVHGLIKTLFPISQASSGVMVPLTAESQLLLSLPVPPGSVNTTRQTVDGN
jgi:hypothetical protein